ncbi:hypothetical protein ACLOJK_027177, partial [Asimina triloba]
MAVTQPVASSSLIISGDTNLNRAELAASPPQQQTGIVQQQHLLEIIGLVSSLNVCEQIEPHLIPLLTMVKKLSMGCHFLLGFGHALPNVDLGLS